MGRPLKREGVRKMGPGRTWGVGSSRVLPGIWGDFFAGNPGLQPIYSKIKHLAAGGPERDVAFCATGKF